MKTIDETVSVISDDMFDTLKEHFEFEDDLYCIIREKLWDKIKQELQVYRNSLLTEIEEKIKIIGNKYENPELLEEK